MKAKCVAVCAALAFAAAVVCAPRAMADGVNFFFTGNGITASGTFTVGPSSIAGAEEVTGITGTFSDTNTGVNVSGAITGLYTPLSYVDNTNPNLGPTVAYTSGGLSYDDLFYPAGNSPAICYDLDPVTGKYVLTYPFHGGQLDIFGIAFNISGSGGYVAELWSNGVLPNGKLVYAAGLANATMLVDDPNSTPGPGVPPPGRYGTMSTPEPATVVLFGFGLLATVVLWDRRRKQAGSHVG